MHNGKKGDADQGAVLTESAPCGRLVDFLFEVGMLRHTPRSGYAFLGSGAESVAEHSFRTAFIGMVLARMRGADMERTVMLCLMHDLHEARTGDLNYVNHAYVQADADHALADCTHGTGLEQDLLPMWAELKENTSPEAQLAHDADQLDLILNLRKEQENGNSQAGEWMQNSLRRLRTPEAIRLGADILNADSSHWWRSGQDAAWWENRQGRK